MGASLARFLRSIDCNGFLFINRRLKCGVLDRSMPLFTWLGGAVCTISICVFLFVFDFASTKTAAQASLALSSSHAIVRLLKRIVSRQRPYLVFPHAYTLGTLWRDPSFPSGHTTAGFSIAAIIAKNFPSAGLVAYTLATFTAISRMYLGQHYPTDVIAGALLGVVSGFLAAVLAGALVV